MLLNGRQLFSCHMVINESDRLIASYPVAGRVLSFSGGIDPSGLSDCLPEVAAGAQRFNLLGIVNELGHNAVAVKVRNQCSALSGHRAGGKDCIDGSFRKDHAKA